MQPRSGDPDDRLGQAVLKKKRATQRSGPPPAALLLISLLMAGGCIGKRPGVADARRFMAAGETSRACDLLEDLLTEASTPSVRLDAVRLYVDCSRRMGSLARAEVQVARLKGEGARLYGQAMLTLARSSSNLERSIELLNRAARAWPGSGEIPFRAGLLLLLDSQPRLARPLLEQGCRLETSSTCAITLAHALLDLGLIEEALAQARASMRLHPKARDLKRGRALVRRIQRRTRAVPPGAKGRFQHAMGLLRNEDKGSECLRIVEEIVLEHPNFAGGHTLVGLAHLRMGNPAEAVVALRRAAKLNPLDATNSFYLALIYQQRQRWDDTSSMLERTLELDPFHLRALKLLGEVQLRTRRNKKAAEVLDLLSSLDPGNKINLRLSARAHLASGHQKRAEERYQRLLKGAPTDFEANLRLAQLMLKRLVCWRRHGATPKPPPRRGPTTLS